MDTTKEIKPCEVEAPQQNIQQEIEALRDMIVSVVERMPPADFLQFIRVGVSMFNGEVEMHDELSGVEFMDVDVETLNCSIQTELDIVDMQLPLSHEDLLADVAELKVQVIRVLRAMPAHEFLLFVTQSVALLPSRSDDEYMDMDAFTDDVQHLLSLSSDEEEMEIQGDESGDISYYEQGNGICVMRRKKALSNEEMEEKLKNPQMSEEEANILYREITQDWRKKYLLRFKNWMRKWLEKRLKVMLSESFNCLLKRYPEVIIHHVENWDRRAPRVKVVAHEQGLASIVDGAVNAVGGLVSGTLTNLLGLQDKPIREESGQPIINRTSGPLSYGVGPDPSIRLGLLPYSSSQPTVGQCGASKSDFNIATLSRIPSILETLKWADSQKAGTLLFQAPVCPTYIPNSRRKLVSEKNYTTYSPTMLAYMSRPFGLWRGSLVYRIQVVKSEFHRARLLIQYDPHGCSGYQAPAMGNNLNHNVVIMDVEEENEITVVVPYMAPRPWLKCNHFVSEDSIKTTKQATDQQVSTKLYLNQAHNGFLKIYVLNDLVRPETVSSSVDVNVYVQAGDDFDLGVIVPLEPLSITIPEGKQYGNIEYPVCSVTGQDIVTCNEREYIQSLWEDGQYLFIAKRINFPSQAQNPAWFTANVVDNQFDDAVIWKYNAKYIEDAVRADPTNKCVTFARSLANYVNKKKGQEVEVQIGDVLEALNENNEHISEVRGDVTRLLSHVAELADSEEIIQTNLNKIQSNSNEHYKNLHFDGSLTRTSLGSIITETGKGISQDIKNATKDLSGEILAVGRQVNGVSDYFSEVSLAHDAIFNKVSQIPTDLSRTLETIESRTGVLEYDGQEIKTILGTDESFGLRKSTNDIQAGIKKLSDCFNCEYAEMQMQAGDDESVVEAGNIMFVDEKVVDHTEVHLTGSTFVRDTSGAMAENDWNVTSILQREYPIDSFKWGTSDDLNKDILRLPIPKGLIDRNTAMSVQQLKLFAFMRAGMRIRVQLNGTPFHKGQLIAYYVPPMWSSDNDKDNYSLMNRVCWPFILLNASVSNSGVLDIPFVHMLSYFSQQKDTLANPSMNTLGQIVIQPLNKLEVGTGTSQSISGTVYASLLNPEVHQPCDPVTFDYGDGYIQGDDDIAVTETYQDYCEWMEQRINALQLDRYRIYSSTDTRDCNVLKTAKIGISAFVDNPSDKNRRKALNALRQANNYLERDADLGTVMPMEFTGSVDDGIRNIYTLIAMREVRTTCKWSDEWHMTMIVAILRKIFAAVPQAAETSTNTREDFGAQLIMTHGMRKYNMAPTTISENSFNEQTIMRRYYPLGMSHALTKTAGFTLLVIPVSPTTIPLDSEDGFGFSGSLSTRTGRNNPIAWISRLFTYWKGSMRYKVVTNGRRANVIVWHDPFSSSGFAKYENVNNESIVSQMNYASALAVTNTQNSVEIEVPFVSPYNMLLVDVHHKNNDLRTQNGCIYIAIENTESTARHTLYVSTGEDFMLQVIKAPPDVYEVQQVQTSDGDTNYRKLYPDMNRSFGDQQNTQFLPGVGIFPGIKTYFGTCGKPEAGKAPCRDCGENDSDFQTEQLKPKSEQMQMQGLFDVNFNVPEQMQDKVITECKNYIDDKIEEMQVLKNCAVLLENQVKELQLKERLDGVATVCEDIKKLVASSEEIVKNATGAVENVETAAATMCGDFKELVVKSEKVVQDATGAISNVDMAAVSVQRTAPYVERASTEVAKAAHEMSERGDALMPMVKGALGEHARCSASTGIFVEHVNIYVKHILTGAAFVNIVEVFRNFSWMQLVSTVTSVCTALMVNEETISNLLATVWSYFRTEAGQAEVNDGPQQQSLEDWIFKHQETVTVAMATVCTTIYVAMFGKMPNFKALVTRVKSWLESKEVKIEEQGMDSMAHWLRDIHFSTMGFKAISSVYKKFEEFITTTIHWWCGTECSSAKAERILSTRRDDIVNWLKELENLNNPEVLTQALSDPFYHNRFYALVDTSHDLLNWIVKEDGIPPILINLIREGRNQCMQLVAKLNEIRPQHGFRYCPFVIMIDGDTGMGKSHLIPEMRELVRKNLDAPNYNLVYSFPAGDEFMSGYEQQTIVEWDDMLQSVSQDVLIPQWIQWISTADVRINMPDLNHKGQFFTSKAFICTTNVAHVNINEVRHMAAFRSRRHCFIGVKLAPGYTTAMMKTRDPDPTFRHLRFSILDSETSVPLRENLHFETMMEIVNAQHQAWHKKQLADIENYHKRFGSMQIPKGIVIKTPAGCITKEEYDRLSQEEQQANERLLKELPFADLEEWEHADDDVEIEAGLDDVNQFLAEAFRDRWRQMTQVQRRACFNQNRFLRALRDMLGKISGIGRRIRGFFDQQYTTVKEKATTFYEQHPGVVRALGFVTAAGCVLALGSMAGKWFNNKPVQEEGVYETGPVRVSRAVKAEGEEMMATTNIAKAVPEGCSDKTSMDVVNVIKDHQVILHWVGGQVLKGLLIGGKLLLTPHHFFRGRKSGDIFRIIRPGAGCAISIEYNIKHAQRLGDKDAVVYYVGPDFPNARHLFKYFLEEKHLKKIPVVDVMLSGLTHEGVREIKHGRATGDVHLKYGGTDGENKYVQDGWSYDMNTKVGECGTILVAVDAQLPAPQRILGIHTAGYANQSGGFSVLITQEQLLRTVNDLKHRLGEPIIAGIVFPDHIVDSDEVCAKIQGDYTLLATVDPKYCPSQPRQTTLTATPFQGEIAPVTKKPSAIHPVGGVSPLWKAINKYGSTSLPFPQKDVDQVMDYMKEEVQTLEGDMPREVVSMEDAVFGQDGVKYCDAMNFSSSAGWPYQCEDRKGGKHHMFSHEERSIIDRRVVSAVEQRQELALAGLRAPSVWRDCLKDELRPIEKVDECKTRLFTIPPVDFTIVCRMYFLAFVQAFYKWNCKFYSAVGLNPESYEWTALYKWLREYGDEGMAGDYSNFDGTLKAQVMYMVCYIICSWYTRTKYFAWSGANLIRYVLVDEMVHTVQLVNNVLYMTHKGNASGNPLTVVINTMCNRIYLMLAWIGLAPPGFKALDLMMQNVRMICYGDDNIVIVKREVQPWFNQVAISEYLAKYGIKYTDELKADGLVPIRKLDDMTFLKRGFRQDPIFGKDYRLPTMDVKTVGSLTNWYRKAPDWEAQVRTNIRCALAFAFFHGEEYYNPFFEKCCETLRKYGVEPVIMLYSDWVELFSAILSGGNLKMIPDFNW